MPVRILATNTLYWGDDESVYLSLGTADTQISLASDYEPFARIVTASTVSTSDSARVYRMNSASAQTITVALSGVFKAGDVLTVVQEGAGTTTIVAATGVTINTALATLVSGGQWSVAQLICIGTNNWVAVGGLGG